MSCEICGLREGFVFEQPALSDETAKRVLCRLCARKLRRELPLHPGQRLARQTYIAELDRFWDESGASEICRRCHEQGTGCCPPMCRYVSASGCTRKNVFCTSFVCSALLNAVWDCDPEQGRILKALKKNPGHSEFRLYEMVTRVPAADREMVRPLQLAGDFPSLDGLNAKLLAERLPALENEILEIRKVWKRAEQGGVSVPLKASEPDLRTPSQ